MHTVSYFYLSRHLVTCMMRLNLRVGPVRTQMTNTQKKKNYEMSAQKITNLRVCSQDEIISKRVIINVCSLDESDSKSIHKSVNTIEVKDATNESVHTSEVKDANNKTKDEEPLVTYNSVINVQSYLKLFEWGNNS